MSGELLSRLAAYPTLRTLLEKSLRPKMLLLSSDKPTSPVHISAHALDTRVGEVISRIKKSVFTGKGDMEQVPGMYKDYVSRMADMLQKTLGSLQLQSAEGPSYAPLLMPEVSAPPALPVRFSSGQLLLVLQRGDTARAAGAQGTTRFGVVREGGRVSLTLAGGDADVAHDECVQAVLPWKPGIEDGMALVHNVEALSPLAESARRLHADVEALSARSIREEQLVKVREEAKRVVEEMALHPLRREVALRSLQAICSKVDAAIEALGSGETASMLDAVTAAVAKLLFDPEAVARDALMDGGTVGARHYASGQWLTVLYNGVWRDAEVLSAGSQHQLRISEGDEVSLQLHSWNHAPREIAMDTFEVLRRWWAESLGAQHVHIADALTGKPLEVLKQCVAINVTGDSQLLGIDDVRGLSSWLHSLHAARLDGKGVSEVAAALLTAPPAAGKTTLISQTVVLALERSELVPIVIKVQLLQVRLREAQHDEFTSTSNWVDAYLKFVHAGQPVLYRMLRQAMMARRALLLIDGLDEGGTNRTNIERHIVEVLAQQGHVMLCTSRPAGVDGMRFSSFQRLQLAPLSEEQQHEALTQRLGAVGVEALMPFVERMPLDMETERRVTANPLMLSMVASIFEIRKGVDMPNTIVKLYESASEAMLARGGVLSAEMRTLIEAAFFEAHAAQVRVITEEQLYRAALTVFAPSGTIALTMADNERLPALERAVKQLTSEEQETLDNVRGRVAEDKLPLLSLLQIEPLQMQSSHLSFQEYFAARAICSGKYRLPEGSPPPWQWPAF